MENTNKTDVCSLCNKEKPIEEFYKNRKKHRRCRDCNNECVRRNYRMEKTIPLEKKCRDCKEVKPAIDFSKNNARKDGLSARCKPCNRIFHRQSKAKNPERYKKYDLRESYNLLLEEWQMLLAFQGMKCALCGCTFEEGGKKPCVDHDHTTGQVRGALCYRCNFKLGVVEDIDFVEKSKNYLISPPFNEVINEIS